MPGNRHAASSDAVPSSSGECTSGDDAGRTSQPTKHDPGTINNNSEEEGSPGSADTELGSDKDTTTNAADKSQSHSLGPNGKPALPRPEFLEPCPRCFSPDTKFCYYNNYNVKQPRFYCKVRV